MFYKGLGSPPTKISAIGLGTGIEKYSSKPSLYEEQVRIIGRAIELGVNLVDTAPVYGNGRSEEVVGKATKKARHEVFVATKVSPEDASYEDVLTSAENSLRRLKTDYIDLYQVHWSNPKVPLSETMGAMEKLVREGKVRYLGVSNFSKKELKEAQAALTRETISSIQTEYNLLDRTIENQILPYCEREGITVLAYSPLYRGSFAKGREQLATLQAIAAKHDKTVAQVVLRWLIAHRPVVAIPSTTNPKRLQDNVSSADFDLLAEEIETINRACALRPVNVPPRKIRLSTETNRPVYRTVEEAKENRLNFVPSPMELAEQIREGEFLKPVRLVPANDPNGRYEFNLIEGRIRYWAWVMAYDGKAPIPAFVLAD